MIRKRHILYPLLALFALVAQAQNKASYTVKYMLSYDETAKRYTAWVVPSYSTPNENNGTSDEKGATAQFSLKVPKGFVLSDLRDIHGAWEKQPRKIGSEAPFLKAGVDPGFEYYMIGKAPMETNYGTFLKDEPVALFSFAGRGGQLGEVSVLDERDPFVSIADKDFSLNVTNSFYSRSGQYRSVTALPREQFTASTTIQNVLTDLAKKMEAELASPGSEFNSEMQVIAYPNPVGDQLSVKYFSFMEKEKLTLEVINMEGRQKAVSESVATYGVNTLVIPMREQQEGMYIVRVKSGNNVINRKVIKGAQ